MTGHPVAPNRAALFDLDGVVVDSRDATRGAIADIATRQTGRQVTPDAVSPLGAPHKELERLGVANAYGIYRSAYDAAFRSASARVTMFSDVVGALKKLKDAGVRLGAITAQPRSRAETMVPPEIRALFDVFLCYNETRGDKSFGIASALKHLDVERQCALYVGDQAKDLEAARKAGVRGVAVLWGFSDEETLARWLPDMTVAEPHELGPVLFDALG